MTPRSRYRLAVERALTENDYARVQLFERKLAQLGVETNLSKFNAALGLAHDGKLVEAYDQMHCLASLNAPGYPPAHVWIVKHLFENKMSLPPAETRRLIGIHLDHLTALGINEPQVVLIRVRWLARDQRLEEAAAVLRPLVEQVPAAAIERLRIDIALDHRDDARRDAAAVSKHMQRQKESGGTLSAQDDYWWAAAEAILGSDKHSRESLSDELKPKPQKQSIIQ